jgi:hypothetical protein
MRRNASLAPTTATFELPDEDLQNVGVDQAPDLPFAIFEIAIKPRILERDCGLRRKHLQYRDTARSENVWRQIVFKVENADEFGLVGSVANRQTGGRWC